MKDTCPYTPLGWGLLREPTGLPGTGVLSQALSKAQAPKYLWSPGLVFEPQKKNSSLILQVPTGTVRDSICLDFYAFEGILSQVKTSSGIQITYVFLLIARNNP